MSKQMNYEEAMEWLKEHQEDVLVELSAVGWSWRVRHLVRPHPPVTRWEDWAIAPDPVAAANAARERLEGGKAADKLVSIPSTYPKSTYVLELSEVAPDGSVLITARNTARLSGQARSVHVNVADLRAAIDEVAGKDPDAMICTVGECSHRWEGPRNEEQEKRDHDKAEERIRHIAREEVAKRTEEDVLLHVTAHKGNENWRDGRSILEQLVGVAVDKEIAKHAKGEEPITPANRMTPYCPKDSCIICPFHDQDREGCMHIYARQSLGDPKGVFVPEKKREEIAFDVTREREKCLGSPNDSYICSLFESLKTAGLIP